MHQVIWAPPGGAPGALGICTCTWARHVPGTYSLCCRAPGTAEWTPETALLQHSATIPVPAPFVAPLQRLYSNALQYYYTTVTLRAIAVILVFHSRRGCERFLFSTNQH